MTLAETGQADALRNELRSRALASLYFFTRAVLGYQDLTPTLHKNICDFVQFNRTRRQVIRLPRGHFKSTIFSKSYPLWKQCKYKVEDHYDAAFVIARETDNMAKRALREVKGHIEQNQILRWLFPEIIPPDFSKTKWDEHEVILPRETPRQEATYTAVGVGAAITGEHYDEQIKDDIIGFEAAHSQPVMRKAIEWHQTSEGLFRSPGEGWDMVIGTNWTDADLYSWIEENEPEYEQWIMSCYDDNGNPIFPERYTKELLQRIEAKQGAYLFSCQYRNDPIPKGGGDFKDEWAKPVTVADNRFITFSPSDRLVPEQLDRVGYFDPRHSEEGIQGTAEHALVVGGRDVQGRSIILSAWSKACGVAEALHQMQLMNDRWHCRWYYEAVGAQKHLGNTIAMLNAEAMVYQTCRYCKEVLKKTTVSPHRALRAEPDTVNTRMHKDERIRTNLQSLLSLYFCEGTERARNQLLRFPNGKLKDLADAIAGLVPYLTLPREPGEIEAEQRQLASAQQNAKPYTDTAFFCG